MTGRARRSLFAFVLIGFLGGAVVLGALLSREPRGRPVVPSSQSPSSVAATPKEGARNLWATEPRVDRAVAFRQSFHLPAQRDWVIAVANMPAAVANVSDYGVPLTDSELRLLASRAQTTEAVSTEVQRYARDHSDSWGGLYVDGGFVVAQLVGVSPESERELRAAVSPGAPLLVRGVRWSLADLQSLRDRLRHDPWLHAKYHVLDLGVDVKRNEVQLRVAEAGDRTVDDIMGHYADAAMLVVTTGAEAPPTHNASLSGHVVDPLGHPLQGVDIELRPVNPGQDPTGDVGIETNGAGAFFISDIPAAEYVVRVLDHVGVNGQNLEGSDRQLIGETRVTVEAGETKDVIIPITSEP